MVREPVRSWLAIASLLGWIQEVTPVAEFVSKEAGGRVEPDAFKVWTGGQPKSPNHMGLVGATIKLGPKVCKTVSVAKFGDRTTGEVKKRVLRLSKYDRQAGGGFDFDNPVAACSVENEEIERLLALLNEDIDHAGRYRVVDAKSPAGDLLSLVKDRPEDLHVVIEALSTHAAPEVIGAALARSKGGLSSAETAVILHRRNLLEGAAAAAADLGVTETDMQRLIGNAWWIFGGRYTGIVPRRQLLQLDEHDIPLVCADRSLHIVELKGPVIPSLIKRHRNHWIVSSEVHEATMQATNYVRTADELGASAERNLREELGIEVDLRRVFATVVIGHREHLVAENLPEEQFDVALRTYNAALNRVQVITYDQLFDAASRSLVFEGT